MTMVASKDIVFPQLSQVLLAPKGMANWICSGRRLCGIVFRHYDDKEGEQ